MEPTPQARQVIAILLQADQKGLSADDYDGPRWNARLAKLKPTASQTSEADAVQFDAALTVCVMRYISDLHIGKVNPKHFDFGLDVETKKYELPEFLKANVMDASDVASALAKVEPPYPGYQRTIQALHAYLEFAKEYDGNRFPPAEKPSLRAIPIPVSRNSTRLLRLVGDLPADANVPADARVYQGPLVDAVRIFSAGSVAPRMAESQRKPWPISTSPSATECGKCNSLWSVGAGCPSDLHSPRPIVANIPEFRLRAYDENYNIAWTMNVVVGKAYDHDTPVFGDTMQYVDIPAVLECSLFHRQSRIPPEARSRSRLPGRRKASRWWTAARRSSLPD